jgi:hypothetical protein
VGLAPAAQLVDEYLDLCEQRRLDAAGAFLADGARLVFPGGATFSDLPSMVAAAKSGYRFVTKPERHYSVAHDGSTTVVTCRGTLAGEWLDGSPLTGVRFVDVFVLAGDRITEQHVFNDLALADPAAARAPSPGLESLESTP